VPLDFLGWQIQLAGWHQLYFVMLETLHCSAAKTLKLMAVWQQVE
jgi:hypothetical protein